MSPNKAAGHLAGDAVTPLTIINIETVPIDSICERSTNARTHSRQQIRQLARSIQKFGFVTPVLVDADSVIVAGHARHRAGLQLGMTEIPIVRLEHLSPAEIRAYVLADNRLAEKAGWNKQLLAAELKDLIDCGFEVALTGFEAAEIDGLLETLDVPSERSENSIPQYAAGPAIAQPGDLWLLGRHRLLCADARAAASYQHLLNEERAHLVFTDPPYNVPIDGHVCGLGRIRHGNFAMGCGEMSSDEFTSFLGGVLAHLARYSQDGSIHYVCMDWRHQGELLAAGKQHYTELKNVCVWNKTNAGMGTFYRSKHELIFVFKNGTAPHINNFELGQTGRYRTNVWDYAGVTSWKSGKKQELAMHPTVKPIDLVADAIKDCSRRGDLVLDPFAGSGSSLMACEMTGRTARAMEIDPAYADVTIKRWQAHTGQSAHLESSGEDYEQVLERRAAPVPNALI
jgi:DNA modification methylase